MVSSLSLLPHQIEALEATKKNIYTLLLGGIGSGKSFNGAVWLILSLVEVYNRGIKGTTALIGANSYRQLINTSLATFFEVCDMLNIEYDYKKQDGVVFLLDQKIIVTSLEASAAPKLKGLNLTFIWIDEVADLLESTFRILQGRLRKNMGGLLIPKAFLTTSPKGMNWLYDLFEVARPDGYRVIKANSYSNVFLPEQFLKDLENTYSSELFQQEVMAEWVASGKGRVYQFNPSLHVGEVRQDPNKHVHIGLDFNVAFMAAEVAHIDLGLQSVEFFDEIVIRNATSPTEAMAQEIKRKYGTKNVTIYPDASCRLRKTNATNTDYAILLNAGFKVKCHAINYRVKDRVNNMNLLMEKQNQIGKYRMKMSNDNKFLRKDLERITWHERQHDGNHFNLMGDDTLGHSSAAAGYLVSYYFGISTPRRGVRVSKY